MKVVAAFSCRKGNTVRWGYVTEQNLATKTIDEWFEDFISLNSDFTNHKKEAK